MQTSESVSGEENRRLAKLELRDVVKSDLAYFFEHQLDPEANQMAAFTSADPGNHQAFMDHWDRILADDQIVNRTILVGGKVAGHLARFVRFGQPEVTYWLGREYWGRGLATEALRQFLGEEDTRPLFARAASDNAASIRVLEKCGFHLSGHDKGFANARGKEIEEVIYRLD